MLRCHSQILGPFTKKLVIFRYDSILKTSFGCSFHKKGVFLHLGNHKHLKKLQRSYKCYFFKEQKNFICTSLYLLKDEKNDTWSEIKPTSSNPSASNKCKKLKNENNVELKEMKPDVSENITRKLPDENTSNFNSKDVEKNDNKNSRKEFQKSNENDTYEFDPCDTVKTSDSLNEKLESLNKNTNQYLSNIIVLAKKKKQTPSSVPVDSAQITSDKPNEQKNQKSNPTFIHCSKPEKTGNSENSENTNKENQTPFDLGPKKESDIKRQFIELSLGEITSDIKLDPNEGLNGGKKRLAEFKTLKEIPKKILLEKAKGILRKTSVLKQEDVSRNVKLINLGAPKVDVNLNITTRRRQTVDLNKCSTERNFITPVRAMTDFLLKPSDLEGLRKTKRRSPYENDPPITVYWRKDVEAKALDVWGSKENLLKEILKRDIERRRYQQNLFTVKRRLRDYRREQGRETEIKLEQNGLFGTSGKVVLTAIAINGTNFLFKLLAWLYTGSHSMFSEAIHSLADTINQLILAYGIHKSVQRADSDHPYGYTNMRYVASLISGVGIFCVGSGLSFYHGFIGLTDPSDLPSFYWAYFILGGSLASEGATLLVAFNSIRMGARKSQMTFSEYVWRGQDPSVNVVLLEDMAAVIGVGFAAGCMGLSSYCESPIPDAIGSFLVGGLLAGVASFIIYTNVAALVGRSIPQERLDKINAELESDVMIRAIHDVKGIDIGNSLVRYKAEMDFDGGELTRSYLDKQDLNQMLEEVKKMQTIDDLEEFMLKHGENIVDMMGGEIDRIELKLRKKHPEIRHCDLEIL